MLHDSAHSRLGTPPALHSGLAIDPAGLHALGRQARDGGRAGLEESARAFEALLLGQMLKQARSAPLAEGLFDSDQSKLYHEMFDQEIARHAAAGRGLGLREVIMRQLDPERASIPLAADSAQAQRTLRIPERNPNLRPIRPLQAAAAEASAETASATGQPGAAPSPRRARESTAPPLPSGPVQWPPASRAQFLATLKPYAERAARELGVDSHVLLAQSALETGWGRHVPRRADGSSSFNLFGIKADRRWQGDRVAVGTLEYRNGVAQREQARFRAYSNPGESFLDYVDFLRVNPRYREVLASQTNRDYVRGLQRAGYATDPRYADKILSIAGELERLGTTARTQVQAGQAATSREG